MSEYLTGRATLPVLLSFYPSATHRVANFYYHFCSGQSTGAIQNDSISIISIFWLTSAAMRLGQPLDRTKTSFVSVSRF
ncbi:hypothetical protein AA14_24335 [Salmonella enterica]|nr:hypothetical protein [Salmonella enterica]ECX6012011.1 hypothetical protein [Salmonella enterica subsp. enterica serovar Rubislaw]EEJ9527354.1 hypothetical protein [Salmonella enterica subsp. enterica serovar Rubislaw]